MGALKQVRWVVIVGLALVSLSVSTDIFASSRDEQVQNWLHFGYDDAYTSYNPVEVTLTGTNVPQLGKRWGIGCGEGYSISVYGSPAIYSGTLYTSAATDCLRAYDAQTGRELWQFGDTNAAWAPQAVASEDGLLLYMAGRSGIYQLYGVDAASGAQRWQAPIGFNLGFTGAVRAVPTVDEARGWVYLIELPYSTGGGKLYAIDTETGEIAWYMGEATHGALFEGNYALLAGGELYAQAELPNPLPPYNDQDQMLRIDPSSQSVERVYDRPDPDNFYDIEYHTLCNDKLVVNFDYQYDPVKLVVAYDTISSTITWQKPFSSTITGKIACNTDKNRIYVPTDPYLYALDAATGTEVWKYLGYGAIYNPSVANGVVYFLSDTNMYAIDEETTARLLRYPLGYTADETTQVAVAGGQLFFSGSGGACELYALGFPKVFLPLVVR